MKKVLIVDDDEGFRESLSALLTLEGYDVQEASNGAEGLARLANAPRPEVVLIDLMMPVMDGWELVRAMKRDPDLARIPSAVVSAARAPESIPETVTVFPKPFSVNALLDFIEAAR